MSMPEALRQVRADLGERAVILETRRTKAGWLQGGRETIHVLAAVEDAVAEVMDPENAPRPCPRSGMSARLRESGMDASLAARIVASCGGDLGEDAVAAAIARHTPVSPTLSAHEGARIALVGPTGVGKTTTMAKLAARFALTERRSVALITMDTYRIGAVDQLATYARVMGVPMEVARTQEEMALAVARHAETDVILIDTVGRSPNRALQLAEIRAFLNAAEITETHLVLAAPGGPEYLQQAAERFSALEPNRLIITKLDEMPRWGVVTSLAHRTGWPVSFITDGQEVPRNIRPADPMEVAHMVLGGEA